MPSIPSIKLQKLIIPVQIRIIDTTKINVIIKLPLLFIILMYLELYRINDEVAIWINSLENLLILKKSSINPVKLKGSKKRKLIWLKM